MMTKADMLRELASVVSDPDFAGDPVGMLAAWADVASGQVDQDDRYSVSLEASPDDGPQERRRIIADLATRLDLVRLADVRGLYPHYHDETLRTDLRALCEVGALVKYGCNRGATYRPCAMTYVYGR